MRSLTEGGLIRCEEMMARQRKVVGQRVWEKSAVLRVLVQTQGDYLKQMGVNWVER